MIKNNVIDKTERVIIAGLLTSDTNPGLFEEDMQEMQLLCNTAGAQVVSMINQKRERPVASTYLGTGKLEEISRTMKTASANTLVIDAQLSPDK